MVRQGETQRPIHRVLDADARRYQYFPDPEAVVAQLQRGGGVKQIQAIVAQAREPKGLAQAAGARGELAGGRAWFNAAIQGHLLQARLSYWLQRTQQHASCLSLGLTRDVHAEVTAVDHINIRMTRGAKEDAISRRGAAMGVGSRVRRIVMRTQIGFRLNNPPGKQTNTSAVHQHLSQQPRSYPLRRRLKEGARQQPTYGVWLGAPFFKRFLL